MGKGLKVQSWISDHVRIADNLHTTVISREIKLDYGSPRELAKLPQNKQEQAYHASSICEKTKEYKP